MKTCHSAKLPSIVGEDSLLFGGTGREVRVNLAVRRTPKPHVTIKYLEPGFTAPKQARTLQPAGHPPSLPTARLG
jgi:hypothetical protein